jgi:F-type H+-transporting ATPase subunit b
VKKLAFVVLALMLGAGTAWAQQHPPKKIAPHGSAHGAHPAASASGKAHHEEGGEHAEHHELGPINWFDFGNSKQPPWGTYAINLALLLAGYWYFGKDAIKNGLKARRARIKQDIDDAQRMLKEAESRAKKYQKKLAELDTDVETATRSLVEAGGMERDRIVREAKEKAARMERDAEFLVEQELKQMRNDIVRETLDATVMASEEILKKTIGQADHERLAEEYLEQLSSMKALDVVKSQGSAP